MSEYLRQLFIRDTPLLDVRAPVEYNKGSFPTAVNLPILNDQERQAVGTKYKQDGPVAAQALGYHLVSGELRQQRLQQWLRFLRSHPNAELYCFRGGERSRIACEWLNEAGPPVTRIEGGYKAMRTFLLEQLCSLPSLLIVSGHTGVGKTELLDEFPNSIDLEGLANHRGSAFGKRLAGQPTQINFENALAIKILQRIAENRFPVLLEDEGRLIGRILVPDSVKAAMDAAPLVVLQEDRGLRVERILRDYILTQYDELQTIHGADAIKRLGEQLLKATDAIRKRLGGVAHQEVRSLVTSALALHERGNTDAHRRWISVLLEKYYDPMYGYQLKRKQDRIIFQGSRVEVTQWLATNRNNAQ